MAKSGKSLIIIGHPPPEGHVWRILGKWPHDGTSDTPPETDQAICPRVDALPSSQEKEKMVAHISRTVGPVA
jgi:hypothetical protein